MQQAAAAAPPASAEHQDAVPARARPRTPAVAAQTNPPLELSGMVMGMEATGKHTLMQRLEGKEPEFNTGGGSRRGRHHHKRSDSAVSNATSESPSAASNSRQQRIVTAPYQTPPNVPKWDDRIQLRVQAGRKVISKHHPVDFYVLLVDPRHDRQKFEKYLSKTVTTALRAQGYGKKTSDTEQQQKQHPFCLCLLRSFRDLLPEEDNGATIIGESDLTAWTLQILQDCAPDLTDPVLQCCNTSLLNCYGLGLLHHFIYQAYVQRKRFDVELQLKQIQQAQTQALREAPAALTYADYCAQVEQLVQNNGAASRRRGTTNDDETSTTSATSSRRKMVGGVLPASPSASSNARGRANSGESSSTLPSSAQPSLVPDAKDALEAFLESDSDDSTPPKDDDNNSSNSSDKNDGEDFFYDESGMRYEAGKGRVEDDSSGNEEPTPTTQRAEEQTNEKKLNPVKSSDPTKAGSDNEGDLDNSVERPSSPTSSQKQTDASQDEASNENAGEEESEHDDLDHPVVVPPEERSPGIDDREANNENDTNGVGSEVISAIPAQKDVDEKVDRAVEASPNKPIPTPADDDEASEKEFFVDDAAGDGDTEEALRDGTGHVSAETGNDKKNDLEPEPNQSADADEPDSKLTGSTHATDEPMKNHRKPVADDDESEREFFIEETGDEDVVEDAPRNVSSADEAIGKTGESAMEEETEIDAEPESKPEISKVIHNETSDEEAEAAATPDSKVAEESHTVDESNRAREEEESPHDERQQQQPRPLPTATPAPATDSGSQISAEARAAIFAAQQDMERMMLEQRQQKSEKPKKPKKSKDGEKKKKSKKEKKAKKEKVESEGE